MIVRRVMSRRLGINLLLERAGCDATTSSSGWNTVELSRESLSAIMSFESTITTHAGVTSIEDWRIEWVIGPFAPVPVLLGIRRSILHGKGENLLAGTPYNHIHCAALARMSM
jgi:hypothetical protein